MAEDQPVLKPGTPVGLLDPASTDIRERSNLTNLQLLYWVGQKLRSDAPLFNAVVTFEIQGKVNPDHFSRAFQIVLGCSDALRTVIVEVDGVPQRKIRLQMAGQVPLIDLSLQTQPEAAFDRWLDERRGHLLDLSKCLFDTALVKLREDLFIWYLNQHHLIVDAASVFLLYREVARCYEALNGETLPVVPGLPSFEAYVAELRSYRTSSRYLDAETFWQQRFADGIERVPFFGRSTKQQGSRVERRTYILSAEQTQRLRAMARRPAFASLTEELALSNILLSLFFVHLHHLSGASSLALVAPFHNRPTDALRNTIGLLMELCPLRVDVDDQDTFVTVAEKVRRETRSVLRYYQYGTGAGIPQAAFDVLFNYHRMPSLNLDGVPVVPARIHSGHGKESLALHVYHHEASNEFSFNFDYHQDLFSGEEKAAALQHFERTVDGFLKDSEQPIANLSFPIDRYRSRAPGATATNAGIPVPSARIVLEPRDPLESQLLLIWEALLQVAPIGVRDNFFDLGGDSWTAVQMFVEIEKVTGRYLPLSTLIHATTIEDLARHLRANDAAETARIVEIQRGSPGRPLYFIPGAAANGLAIARIAKHLERDRPVYMLQEAVASAGPVPFLTVEQLASDYMEALLKVQPEGPYLLAGYSAGGIIAFELAQQLQARGHEIPLLAVIDVPAQSAYMGLLRKGTSSLCRLLGIKPTDELDLFLRLRDLLFVLHSVIYRLRPHPQLFAKFVNLVRTIAASQRNRTWVGSEGATSGAALGDIKWKLKDPHLRELYVQRDRAVRSYVPGPYPGRITLFRSTFGYQRQRMRSPYHDLGWGKLASGGVELFEVPGNHINIVREPAVERLAEQLTRSLKQIETGSTR